MAANEHGKRTKGGGCQWQECFIQAREKSCLTLEYSVSIQSTNMNCAPPMCSTNPVSSTFKMNSKYRTSCHLHSNHLIQAPSSRTWINGIGPLTGLSVSTLSLLQSILHPAFRLILLKCKSYHDVPLLETLPWLSACSNKIPNPFLAARPTWSPPSSLSDFISHHCPPHSLHSSYRGFHPSLGTPQECFCLRVSA